MRFLSNHTAEPVKTVSDLNLDGGRSTTTSIPIPEKITSTNGVLKRVTTLFNPRKRNPNVSLMRYGAGGNAPVGFIRDAATVYPRSSSGSSSADEIRRPSGLGRRASSMESLRLPIGSIDLEASSGDGGKPKRSKSLPD